MTPPCSDTFDDKLMFVAGTLVHTPGGPVPIEQLRVGDLVTSRHEDRDECESRRVTSTTSRDGLELCLMPLALSSETVFESLVHAGNRLMWTPEGWRRVDQMVGNPHVDVARDPESLFIRNLRLLETDIPDVAWTQHQSDVGPTVDLRGGGVRDADAV